MNIGTGLAERIIIAMPVNEPTYATKISKISRSNQTHILKVLSELKRDGIMKNSETIKNHRTKLLELTEKGKEIKKLLIKLKELINGDNR